MTIVRFPRNILFQHPRIRESLSQPDRAACILLDAEVKLWKQLVCWKFEQGLGNRLFNEVQATRRKTMSPFHDSIVLENLAIVK
ncbi:hypothetical protein A5M96_06195 [Streptococcus pneumoniae]|nr:hypothetical protein NTPn20_10450 [Streptococcus pneumoniae]KXW19261.1 hypothetical protein NTPn29_03625 [Streptococcus pneumoniae]KXW20501.1 hypothetical protein NTPn30_05750 [Streptococcus pneumoniae]KXW22411.1 hypothetical protein NTPn31_06525 [Streptococcus pneumoniae]KXW37826.1 hypothetical protein NTPn42_08605 [Streptococcus pneumoniae]